MTWGDGRTSRAEHRRWARAVKNRDNWQCQRCGYQGHRGAGDVHADHIKPYAEGGTDTLDNGVTLCRPCHQSKSEQERLRGLRRHNQRKYAEPEPHPGSLPRQ